MGDGSGGAGSRHDGAIDGERQRSQVQVASGPGQRDGAQVDVLSRVAVGLATAVIADGDGVGRGGGYTLADNIDIPRCERIGKEVTERIPADGAADRTGASERRVNDSRIGGGSADQKMSRLSMPHIAAKGELGLGLRKTVETGDVDVGDYAAQEKNRGLRGHRSGVARQQILGPVILAEGADVGIAPLRGETRQRGGANSGRAGAGGSELAGFDFVRKGQDLFVRVAERKEWHGGTEDVGRLDCGLGGGWGSKRVNAGAGGVALFEEGDDLAMKARGIFGVVIQHVAGSRGFGLDVVELETCPSAERMSCQRPSLMEMGSGSASGPTQPS